MSHGTIYTIIYTRWLGKHFQFSHSTLILLSLTALLFFTSTYALAAECRLTKSVTDSAANLETNSSMGGELKRAIKAHHTEAGAYQFTSYEDFKSAWLAWQQHRGFAGPTPKSCDMKNDTYVDCVTVKITGTKDAYICDQYYLDKCMHGHHTKPIKIAFQYQKNANGIWILNSAYPSIHDNCS